MPTPTGLSISSVPPSALTRSASPLSPEPRAESTPPAPSSRTSTTVCAWPTPTRTSIRSELACLEALVSASATTKYAVVCTDNGSFSQLSRSSSTGTVERPARAASAASRPRSVRMPGWIPRASSRSSSSAASSSAHAAASSRAAAESGSRLDSRSRRLSASETSRCWAPSWRSRSMRRRAASAVSTIRARDAASCSRASTLARAAVTNSAKLPILASVPAGNACARSLDTMSAPQRRPAT